MRLGLYETSSVDRYTLLHDGHYVYWGTEAEVWEYIHDRHSFSVDHALKHEGYEIVPEEPTR